MLAEVYAAKKGSREFDCMSVNVVFRNITLLTYTRPICITKEVVVKSTVGEAAVALKSPHS